MVNELDRFESLLNDLLEISATTPVWPNCRWRQSICARPSTARWATSATWPTTPASSCCRHAGDEVIAEIDARRVERILRNLIANAIDHAEHKPVRIRMAADEDTVAVTVRDYGVA